MRHTITTKVAGLATSRNLDLAIRAFNALILL